MTAAKTMKDVSKDSAIFKASLGQAREIFYHAYKSKFGPPIEGRKEQGWHQFPRGTDELVSASAEFSDVNYFDEEGHSVWVGILAGGNRWVWKAQNTVNDQEVNG